MLSPTMQHSPVANSTVLALRPAAASPHQDELITSEPLRHTVKRASLSPVDLALKLVVGAYDRSLVVDRPHLPANKTRFPVSLSLEQYKALQDRIEQDPRLPKHWFECKLHYSYTLDGDTGQFVVRMDSHIHSEVLAEIILMIDRTIERLKNRTGSEQLSANDLAHLESIHWKGNSRSKVGKNISTADAFFSKRLFARILFAAELGFSQDEEQLFNTVKKWQTHGARTLVTIKIPYENPAKRKKNINSEPTRAAYTIWRDTRSTAADGAQTKVLLPGEIVDFVKDQTGNMTLRLSDFLHHEDKLDTDYDILIPHKVLYEALKASFVSQADSDNAPRQISPEVKGLDPPRPSTLPPPPAPPSRRSPRLTSQHPGLSGQQGGQQVNQLARRSSQRLRDRAQGGRGCVQQGGRGGGQ